MRNFEEDEVVVSGIGGNFPECDTLDELVDNLMNGVDMVTEERPRWEPGQLGVPVRTGKMKSLEKCDAQYFGLIGKQCHALDPITRKVLERTYEAIFDAGLNPADFSGSKTGVFVGLSILETEMCLMDMKGSNAYNILGRNKTMNANRVSYWLDLKGPSLALDCSWSSGLQALALGCQYLKSGICEAAIVAAGSSIIHANFSSHFSNLNMLSPEGKSKCFDETANGYARSEAVVVLLLQKLKNAKRNYGIIVNAMCTTVASIPGRLIVPSEEQWLRVYKEFYERCKVAPEQVTFLEANGMACQDGDIAELNSASEFFCRQRDSSRPLLVGSVKANLGHTLASGGLCSVIKVLIANKIGVIPPNLHYGEPNKSILGLLSGTMKVVTKPTPLEGQYVAVNDFGFGGTFGHCLIKRPPSRYSPPAPAGNIPSLVLFSGRNEEGINATLTAVESLPYSPETIRMIHDVFSKNINHHMYRGYTILSQGDATVRSIEPFQGGKRPIWFIFSGMGSHWATMGRDLMRLPVYKESIDFCHKTLQKKGLDLWDILTRDDSSMFDNILNSFVSISSTQIALVDVLYSIGIKPDGIIGHSAGELGAAYADGCLTREEMILSSYSRGKVSNEVKVIKGMMAAIGAGYADMKDRLPEDVEVACHNSSTNCTISGPAEKVSALAERLKQEGIFVKAVNVSNIAFHSKHIRGMGPKLKEELSRIITNPKKRSNKWVSSSVPESRWDEPEWDICSPEYLTNNLLSPVYFEEACRHIPKNAIVIEIAPHSLLISILKRSLSKDCINLGLTHRNAPDQLVHLLQTIGKMYTIGLQPQISALYPDVEFPVSQATPFLGHLATWDHSFSWSSKVEINEDSQKMSRTFDLHLDEERHCRSFRFNDKSILPCSMLLTLVVKMYASIRKMNVSEVKLTLSNVFFTKSIKISENRDLTIEVTRTMGAGEFELLMGEEVIATGFVSDSDTKAEDQYSDQVRSAKVIMDQDEVYSQLAYFGYEYQECLKSIKKLSVDNTAWETVVEWKGDLTSLIESLIQCHLLAFSHPDHLQELKFIRELTLELSSLPGIDSEIRLTLDTKTGVMSSTGISIKGLKFKMTEIEPLHLNCNAMPVTATTDNDLKDSYIQYYSSCATSKQLGYSIKTSQDTKIIGVGTFDDTTKSILPDDILQWEIPEKWRLDEAATVPFPYCLAYYILEIISAIRKDDSVMITNADSNIGLACIAVALQHTRDIWAIVKTKEAKQMLSKKFEQLKNTAVVEERASEFFNDIFPRKRSRMDIVINIGAERETHHCLELMGNFGHVFQIYIEDIKENDLLTGIVNLVRSGSIYGITLQRVLSARPDDKAKVKELIARGIESGVVAPFTKCSPLHRKSRESRGNKGEVISLENYDKIVPKLSNSYLVVCEHIHDGLKIAEWFAKRHAKKVRIVHSEKSISSSSEAKINFLKQSTSLVVNHLESFDEASLKRCVPEVGSVHVAVVLPVDKDGTTDFSGVVVRFFSYSDTKAHLVCVLRPSSRGVDLCTERIRTGLPTTVVLWKGPVNGKLRQFTKVLDGILIKNSESVIQVEREQEFSNNIEKDVDQLLESLPKNVGDVGCYGETVSDEVRVTEMRTLSLPFEYSKETLPVFLLPGIKAESLIREKFRNSIYPTFLVEPPHLGSSSLEELSSYVMPKMRSITKGPFILVGEQWGGCMALELCGQLERMGYKAHVFLLSGTPAEVVDPLKYIANTGDPLEVSLISRLLQIKDEEVLQQLSNMKNWNSKLNYCSQFLKFNQKNVLKGLDAIKWRLEALLNYSEKMPLNGPLTIVTKKKMIAEHYKHLCKERVIIYEVNDEEDILNDNIFRMIHDTAIHKALGL